MFAVSIAKRENERMEKRILRAVEPRFLSIIHIQGGFVGEKGDGAL
jgi:hypothetical protein